MKYNIDSIIKKLLIKYPDFSDIINNTKFIENDNEKTACTDGKDIYYNPNFMKSLSKKQQLMVLAHEVCHIALNHINRLEDKNLDLWNIATDAVINANLEKDGCDLFPGCVQIKDALEYDSEELYEKLLQIYKDKKEEQLKKQNQGSQGQSEQGQSSQGQGEQNQDGQGQSEQGQSSQGQGEQKQDGQGQNEQGQNSQGQEGQNQDGQGQNEQGHGSQGQGGQNQDGQGQNEQGQNSQGQGGQNQNKVTGSSQSKDNSAKSFDDIVDSIINHDESSLVKNHTSWIKEKTNDNEDINEDKSDENKSKSNNSKSNASDKKKKTKSDNKSSDNKKETKTDDDGKSDDKKDDGKSDDKKDDGKSGDKKDDGKSDDKKDDGKSDDKKDDGKSDDNKKILREKLKKKIKDRKEEKTSTNENNDEVKEYSENDFQKRKFKKSDKDVFEKNRNDRLQKIQIEKDKLKEQLMLCGQDDANTFGEANIGTIGNYGQPIDWRRLLRESISRDIDWTLRNAEVEDGIVLSRLEEFPCSETEIVLDTSGSVSVDLLKNFLREVKNILKNSKIKVGCFDTRFYGFEEIKTMEDIENFKFRGFGGTDFNAAVNAFTKRVDNRIVFTDGYAPMPDKKVKAIWLVYGDGSIKPDGGKVIHITPDMLNKLNARGRTLKRY